jgi:ABC-type lipoprotein export system ATPase subunit
MLSCRSLKKTYVTSSGAVTAVRGLDIEIPMGQFAAVIGRSGSGKSSLMAMLGGLSRPDSGSIKVHDTEIWTLGDNALTTFRNRKIGYVFQSASLLPALRVIDNVVLPALLGRSMPKTEAYGHAAELLTRVGLSDHADAYPSEISAGERRRAAIARAFINRPAILLADEPTADLDEATERQIMAELLRINREARATLVLVTHNLELAAEAQQVLHIDNGVIAT